MKKKIKKKTKNKIKKVILVFLIIVFIFGISYICHYLYNNYKNKKDYKDAIKDLNVEVDETQITDNKTKRMLQLKELQSKNSEIIGWLEIKDTNINYPVLQTKDNDFYLKHNYKKEKTTGGSLFLDKDFDLKNGSSNYLIYGHRNKQGLVFEDLMKYTKEDFYKNHKTIRFTTNNDDSEYEIMAIFYSKIYYKNEKDVFRYYQFVNAKDEKEYNEFTKKAKKSSIYKTEVDAKYGEQLLTLSTCEYSKKDGRFVVVAKK